MSTSDPLGAPTPKSSLAASAFICGALAAGLGRALLEIVLLYGVIDEGLTLLEILDFISYYLAIGVSMAWALRRVGGLHWDTSLTICAAGYSLSLLPPLMDWAFYGAGNFRYFYGSEIPVSLWFQHIPMAMPIGEITALGLVVLGSAVLTGVIRASVFRALLVLIVGAGVVVLHIYGLPSLARWMDGAMMPFGSSGSITVVQALWAAMLPCLASWAHLRYLVIRLNHVLPWALATCLGAALTQAPVRVTLPIGLVASYLFLSLIVENDLQDRDEDAFSSWIRPFDFLDRNLHRLASGIILSVMIHALDTAGLALAIFYFSGVLYSLPPLRLKSRPFPSMYLLEGLWGFCVVLAGTEFSTLDPGWTLLASVIVGGGFFLVSPVKDRKDLEGDREAGVPSAFVVLSGRGLSPENSERIVGGLAAVTLGFGALLLGVMGRGHPIWLGCAVLATTGVYLGMVRPDRPVRSTLFSLGSVNLFLCLTLGSLVQEEDPVGRTITKEEGVHGTEGLSEESQNPGEWTEQQESCVAERHAASGYLGMKQVGEDWYVLLSRGAPVKIDSQDPCVLQASP